MPPAPPPFLPRVLSEYVGFLASFTTLGAVAFYWLVLRPARKETITPEGAGAERYAGEIGVVGALLAIAALLLALAMRAATRHTPWSTMLVARGPLVQGGLAMLALLGFALARRTSVAGWTLALLASLALVLREAFEGQWRAVVNPVHRLAGGFWIGTLFVLFAAGIPIALRGTSAVSDRERLLAAMVNRFSNLALVSAGVLVLTGVITAVLHLKTVPALWSTVYGITFLVKLAFVIGVFALGAWNWRRVRPALGVEGGGLALRRSARAELVLAGIVLLVTGVLTTVPAPRRPGAPPPGAAAGAGQSASPRPPAAAP